MRHSRSAHFRHPIGSRNRAPDLGRGFTQRNSIARVTVVSDC